MFLIYFNKTISLIKRHEGKNRKKQEPKRLGPDTKRTKRPCLCMNTYTLNWSRDEKSTVTKKKTIMNVPPRSEWREWCLPHCVFNLYLSFSLRRSSRGTTGWVSGRSTFNFVTLRCTFLFYAPHSLPHGGPYVTGYARVTMHAHKCKYIFCNTGMFEATI